MTGLSKQRKTTDIIAKRNKNMIQSFHVVFLEINGPL